MKAMDKYPRPWNWEVEYVSAELKVTTGQAILRDVDGKFIGSVPAELAPCICAAVDMPDTLEALGSWLWDPSVAFIRDNALARVNGEPREYRKGDYISCDVTLRHRYYSLKRKIVGFSGDASTGRGLWPVIMVRGERCAINPDRIFRHERKA